MYGREQLGNSFASLISKRLLLMPSGLKMRCCTNSSQLIPATSPTRYPAAIYIRFWYWNRVRKSLLSSRYCNRSNNSLRVRLELYHIKSWRGRPERCVTRSRGVMRSVAKLSNNLNDDRYFLTGVSQSSFPSSTSSATEVAVNAFVQEAMGNSVSGVTSNPSAVLRSPNPCDSKISPSLMIATAQPCTFHSSSILRTKSSIPSNCLLTSVLSDICIVPSLLSLQILARPHGGKAQLYQCRHMRKGVSRENLSF